MATKFCPKCSNTKPTKEFRKNATRADGLSGWCSLCMQEAVKSWKELHPENLRVHSKTWYAKNKEALRER